MTLPLKVHSLLSNSKTSLSAPSPEYASSPSTANSGVKLYELATPRLAVVSAMSPPKPAPRNGVNVQRDSDDGCASADDESSSTVANVRAIAEIFRMSPSSGRLDASKRPILRGRAGSKPMHRAASSSRTARSRGHLRQD